ncbi:hypothetical protein [Marinobacter sp.]|jgi:hypothetical protein|uniref:phage adaptor protein n=1 Tax=Marinobacter sp. TaxID=50741 RepID=UPI00235222D7|nr:hypothetical protein [Marinobacter sp.]|tara:strand:- start:471 stop:737 length:267 start_codon:yes stop_codon:yes gene_type:complete
MTQKQLIETVKQHHPDLQDAQIRIFLNKALDEFCRKTRILKTLYTFSTTIDKRYYRLADNILEVTRVDYDNYRIPRLVGQPEKIDTDI